MTFLLDTHVLIWAVEFPAKLSPRVRTLIADAESVLLVSAISAFELANKVRLGKLPAGEKLHADYELLLVRAGITSVPVSAAIALRAGRLVSDHRDPFDRIIAATALAADVPLLSIDGALDAFQVQRIW